MRRFSRSLPLITTWIMFTGIFITSFFLYCIELPPDPDNPSNSRVYLKLESSGGYRSEQLIIDTVGENVKISVIRFLPSYIRTTTLKIITSEGMTEWDTTLLTFSNVSEDTINVMKNMVTAGDKKVIATVYIENDAINSDTALLNIINRIGSNTRPDFTIKGSRTLNEGETCSLSIEISDPDQNQTHSIIARYKGVDSILPSSSYIWKPAEGFTGEDSVIFTVTDNGIPPLSVTKSAVITVVPSDTGSVVPGDHQGPLISIKSPEHDSAKISSSTFNAEITCTDQSGVMSVACTLGTRALIVTRGAGNSFSAAVSGLVSGQNTLTFTARDSSSNANVTKKSFVLIYDPSMDDNVPPVVTLKSPLVNEARVQTLPLTVQIVCRDDNGIDSVGCVLKGAALAVSKSQDSLYSVQITTLTAGTNDTIHFTITDNSTKHNSRTFPVIVNYNRPPSELTVSSPASGATGVTRSPSFTWSGGVDPDDDSVFYRIIYGTAASSLTAQTAVFHTSPAVVPTGIVLEPKTVYYWQLIAWTKVYNDTVRSSVVSFTTTGTGPAISEHPQNQQVKTGQKAYFHVVASGTDLIYQWQKNGAAIPGATSPACTTSQVTAGDNGAIFRCKVYNALDTVFSNDASLTVMHSVTYSANTASGNVPIDTNGYASGNTVIIKSNTDVGSGTPATKTGYTFSGWSTSTSGSGKTYKGDGADTLKMPLAQVTLYAKWAIDTFTVTFISTGTTVFQTQKITYNGQATLPVSQPVLAGSAFEGWFTTNDISGVSFDFSSPITANRTLYARWASVYSVLYQANGGSGSVPTDSKKYKNGEQATVLGNTGGLTKANNDFAGWSQNAQGTGTVYNAGDRVTVGSEDVNLYAKWTIKQCQITYNTHGGSAVASQIINCGSQITEPVSALAGLTLVGWFTDAGYTSRWDFATTVTSSMTLHAKWEVRDRDGNSYDTVRIGTQTWMVQNLRTTKYNDGTPIPLREDPSQWSDIMSLTGGYCWYGNLISHKDPYGALYNGATVNTGKLAPVGWHVASSDEWTALENYLTTNGHNCDPAQTDYNTIAKTLAAKSGWGTSVENCAIGNNLSQNNNSGFSAYPSGYCQGEFNYLGTACSWWTSTVQSPIFYNLIWSLDGSSSLNSGVGTLNDGRSVRCIKD